MIDEKLYMINESLLGDVEVDEVNDGDSNSGIMNFHFKIDYSGSMSTTVECQSIAFLIRRFLDSLANTGYVEEYSNVDFHTKSGLSSYFSFNVQVSNGNVDSFNDMTARMLKLLDSFDKESTNPCNISIYGDLYKEEDVKLFINIKEESENSKHLISLGGNEFYKKQFGNDDILALYSIIPALAKYNVMKPVDKNRTRFCIYNYDERVLSVVDKSGKVYRSIPQNTFAVFALKWFYNEYDLMRVVDSGSNYNFIDLDGNYLLDEDLNWSSNFSEGYCVITRQSDKKQNFINHEGVVLNPDFWFDKCEDVSNGISICRYQENSCIYKPEHKPSPVIATYRYITRLDKSPEILMASISENGFSKYIFIGLDGKPLCKMAFDSCRVFKNGYAKVENDSLFNYIKEDGTILLKKWHIDVCGYPDTGICAVQDEKYLWSFIDVNTEEPINDLKFTLCEEYTAPDVELTGNDRLYKVGKTNKIGMSYNMARVDGGFCSRDEWFAASIGIRYLCSQRLVCTKFSETNVIRRIIDYHGNEIRGYESSKYEAADDHIRILDLSEKEARFIDMDGNDMLGGIWHKKKDVDYIGNGFFKVKTAKSKSNVFAKDGTKLLKDDLSIYRIDYVEPEGYFIIVNSSLKYNIFDTKGKPLFKKWVYDRIKKFDDGLVQIGSEAIADYEGNVVIFI